jgi:nicotinate-nucleotide adenylyltransferase
VPPIGILGGTFNPPHIGHLICARAALEALELQRVLLMPAAQPPHKEIPDDPSPQRRLELCRLAVAGDDRLEASAVEVERGGRSYTVDTLAALRETRPEDELTFIAGGDMALGLPSWREPERVLELARFAVAEREGADREAVREALAPLGADGRLEFFDMPRVDVSSSEIRRRVAAGRSVRYLVPEAVAEYVAGQGLYRARVAAG